ncbi:hypothetical protein N177_0429 [Lutibaculum baratangense AMV1]|uniref:Uncharacterized protein n=1 Tax=Lutibaculum baratangense AMV1 TaxID=631454 RepID=V4TMN2_9HYPH|nr:hypothetical protein N177_0429 [Lutibaculum baratangense AMV1]
MEDVRIAVAECIRDRKVLDVSGVTSRIYEAHRSAIPSAVIEQEVVAAALGAAVPMKIGGGRADAIRLPAGDASQPLYNARDRSGR